MYYMSVAEEYHRSAGLLRVAAAVVVLLARRSPSHHSGLRSRARRRWLRAPRRRAERVRARRRGRAGELFAGGVPKRSFSLE